MSAEKANAAKAAISASPSRSTSGSPKEPPLTIGVFGGSFNPIHLGHALLAITVQQTKSVDQVVLVPVYKHAVKKDLLPFDDRVMMCELAVQAFGDDVVVSTIERDVGESNGAMLRGLKKQYPVGTRFLWICGDDFFIWMHRPKGLETLAEVSGLIVQRRLHRKEEGEGRVFYKEPIDEAKVRAVAMKMNNLEIDYIYGELPHFSSTLVRRAPGHWRSFLSNPVAKYLEAKPHLLQQLLDNLDAEVDQRQQQKFHKRSDSTLVGYSIVTQIILRGLDIVHALQFERGHTGLYLSLDSSAGNLLAVQGHTDALLQEIESAIPSIESSVGKELDAFDEAQSLAAELKRIPVWLNFDRMVLEKRSDDLRHQSGSDGWLARLSIVEKFNPRIDVLIAAIVRSLTEVLEVSHKWNKNTSKRVDRDVPELLLKWCQGKEALGRLRAFVCAGGPNVPDLVRRSFKMREKLNQTIDAKERCLAKVLVFEADMSSRLSAPDALHKMLEKVTLLEYSTMGCFSSSTPIMQQHKLLLDHATSFRHAIPFEVLEFFDASTLALDFLLSFSKALAASACASA